MTGDCYVAAFNLLFRTPGTVLCHGYVVGTGGDVEGVRYDHAWVEKDGTVYDRSNGHAVETPAFVYYAVGRIRGEDVTRYAAEEALDAAAREMTYGPWEKVTA